ncbi:hypothetical protein [Komagataeibacter xylinus]|nr:hypothetical protein [Komagataeibacter xylinus]
MRLKAHGYAMMEGNELPAGHGPRGPTSWLFASRQQGMTAR